MRKKEGVTLISLAVTIVVLLILASVATYSGTQVIKTSQLTAFTTELKIMQTQVNALYEERDNLEEYGDPIEGSLKEQADKVFAELAKDTQIGISGYDGYRYWSNDRIRKLGIEGIDRDFFVNLEKRKVVSCQGLEQDGKIYYTLSQLPDNLYNVEYEEPQAEKPNFEVNTQNVNNNKWKITVSNIQYNGYIDKWQVKYKLEEKENWNITKDLSFIVDQEGIYKIQIVNGNVLSEEKEIIVVKHQYVKEGLILHYDAINNTGEGEEKHSTTTTVWKDLSGNKNDGILQYFNHTEESGWKAKGLKLDGKDDIIKTNGQFDFSTFQAGTSFSYGATITLKDVSEKCYGIMTNMTTWGQGGFNIQYNAVEKIAIGMGEYLNSVTKPTENVTYNIYGVYDGSIMKLYVNGKLENSKNYNIKPGSKIFTIGYFYDTPSLPMNGEILNIKFYNRALTEEEITKNFEMDKLRFEWQD